jgi:hypothetical protein
MRSAGASTCSIPAPSWLGSPEPAVIGLASTAGPMPVPQAEPSAETAVSWTGPPGPSQLSGRETRTVRQMKVLGTERTGSHPPPPTPSPPRRTQDEQARQPITPPAHDEGPIGDNRAPLIPDAAAAIGTDAGQPSTRPSQSRHGGCTGAGLPGHGESAPGEARLLSSGQRPGHIWSLCRSGLNTVGGPGYEEAAGLPWVFRVGESV